MLAWFGPEELHFFMIEPEDRLVGEAPVDLLRREEDGWVVPLLLSAALGLP